MKKNPIVFLRHILESIEWILRDTENLSEIDFIQNVPIQDAVIRRIEIIGEAAHNLPEEFKKAHPESPWQDISDTRNKLIHEYFDLDLELIWEVVKKDIPPLREHILLLLKEANQPKQ